MSAVRHTDQRQPRTRSAPAVASRPSRPGAVEIAAALGRPRPTDEQLAVIEAPLGPLLVVAGAGSGKTETMAARVVWLVAGGDVLPQEVLGLTFTRKAAAELSDRIRQRLRTLRGTGLWTPDAAGREEADRAPAAGGSGGDAGEVVVSTYHAFAGRLVREHGLRLGVEPHARLLSEAAAWQLASEVVERWGGEMSSVDSAVSTVTAAVLDLAGECAEHLVPFADIDTWLADRVVALDALPYGGARSAPTAQRAKVRELVRKLGARRQLLPIVQAFVQAKRDRDSVDFGDQVAFAARLAQTVPALVAAERAGARAVLLDEFQDTSHAQLVMLQSLYGDGHAVTAVGDPHQSIYGWRGASAGTLLRFRDRFPDAAGHQAPVRSLSTSWRNDVAVLDAANTLAAPLTARTAVAVERLRARPGAGPGQVLVRAFETVEDEADAVAEHLAALWWRGGSRTEVTAAVLCRKRSQFEAVEAALTRRGLPVEVVGLGGLLATAEVADVLAALHAVHDPSRGDRLMRLLTGAMVRLGPRDVVALGSWSRELHRRRAAAHEQGAAPAAPGVPGAPGARGPAPQRGHETAVVLADVVDESSLVEALDELPPPGWADAQGRTLSDEGRRRLLRLATTLRRLRRRTGLSLPDLVVETERALLLDVEVASRPGVRPAAARAQLDALAQVAEDFQASADRPTVGAFLSWLEAAAERERGLEPGEVEVDTDAVQLMTVHAAKGLEWDVVAVPGLVEGTFPAHTTRPSYDGTTWTLGQVKDQGWLADLGSLPHALRGDADGLPDVRWSAAADQQQLERELEDFRRRGGEHELAEERRLAYVALTRARERLLLTSHVWSDGSTPRLPSRFLDELAAAGAADVGPPAPVPDDTTANPRTATARTVPWPLDPLGARRADVEAGAARVAAALAAAEAADAAGTADAATGAAGADAASGRPAQRPAATSVTSVTSATPATAERARRWEWEAGVLLAERAAGRERAVTAALPSHLSASRLVQLARDPRSLALDVRRPVPREPVPQVRRGTAFHAWVERQLGAAAMVDVTELPGAADDGAADDGELAHLQRTWLASEWAGRDVVAVEATVETPIDGTVVRCRVDAVLGRLGGGVDVVDWKTGRPPTGEDARAGAVQLAVYRLAWSRLRGVPLDQVGAAFFYASTGQTVRPVDLLDEGGLVRLLRGVDAVG